MKPAMTTTIHTKGGLIFHVQETLEEIWDLLSGSSEESRGCLFLNGYRSSAVSLKTKRLRIAVTEVQAMEER
jgi:hypothetical protein